MIECTTKDCGNPTATYLCSQCTRDLQAWLDKIPELVADLHVTVARLDRVRKQTGGGGGGKAGSAAPINLDAYEIRWYLSAVTLDAADHAKQADAAVIAWNIQDAITKAEILVSGPIEKPIDHEANKRRVADIAEPMPTRQLLPWLREKARITITARDIQNWAARGKIRAHARDPLPTYHPAEVLDAWHATKKEPAR